MLVEARHGTYSDDRVKSYYRARYYDPSVGRFLSEDPTSMKDDVDAYTYVANSSTNYVDPLGLFKTTDNIKRHPTNNIDPFCPGDSGGACTLFRAAVVICTCDCDASGYKPNPELRLYGDIYVYNGPWQTLRRKPKDKSVVDAGSAINHEYNVHINPAKSAVSGLINGLEGKTFKSEEECQSECSKTSDLVNKLFKQTLKKTQDQENNQ